MRLIALLLFAFVSAANGLVTIIRGGSDFKLVGPGSLVLYHCRTGPQCASQCKKLTELSEKPGCPPAFLACVGSDVGILREAEKLRITTLPALVYRTKMGDHVRISMKDLQEFLEEEEEE